MEKEAAPSQDQPTRGDSENASSIGQSTPFAAVRQQRDAQTDFRLYLNICCGDTPGWLHTGVGLEPFISEKGRYGHKTFVPRAFRWPDDADDVIELLLAESQHSDVWVCPNVMAHDSILAEDGKKKTGRGKGQAVARLTVHSDIDSDPFDSAKAEKLAAVGGFAVASGTSGNAHVYVPLSSSVSVGEHEALCVALGEYIGGADPAKHSDNDLLRPPGTLNHKPRVFDGEAPARVRWWS